jgi:hypothetical protein
LSINWSARSKGKPDTDPRCSKAHITAWEDVARRRLLGELPDLTDEENWPEPKNRGPEDWARALEGLKSGHLRLRETAASVANDLLDSSPTGKYSTR